MVVDQSGALAVFGCNTAALPIDAMINPSNANAQFVGVADGDGARGASIPANNMAAYAFVEAYVKSGGNLKMAQAAAQKVYTNSNNYHEQTVNGRTQRIYDDRKDQVTSRPIQ